MPFFVYILQADDGMFYVGHTKNLDDRLQRHRQGRSLATKSRSGWRLLYKEEFATRPEAVRREREIKSKHRREYIEKLVRTSIEKLEKNH
ncbi:MAG: GIY-YIG nuclease family protein [candidate division Zixibacteria bacterium]|nr:GIY-YIG nuclease family protein [candidate division Zixibacteria bacterium]